MKTQDQIRTIGPDGLDALRRTLGPAAIRGEAPKPAIRPGPAKPVREPVIGQASSQGPVAPGMTLQARYKGRDIRVLVTGQGFETEDGRAFDSLSGAAKAATGARSISGPALFKIGKYLKKS